MEKLRLYKNSKEIPFLIYKKIEQTGDFLYMIKGYEDGDEIEGADTVILEEKYNDLIRDFSIISSGFSQDMHDHASYLIATMEYNRLTAVLNAMDLIINTSLLLTEHGAADPEEDVRLVAALLEGIIVERNPDLIIQREKIIDKMSVHEINILKYKEITEKDGNEENPEENDIDEQLINICLILEIPIPDESKISLYQYYLMTKKAIERVKQIEKINSKS